MQHIKYFIYQLVIWSDARWAHHSFIIFLSLKSGFVLNPSRVFNVPQLVAVQIDLYSVWLPIELFCLTPPECFTHSHPVSAFDSNLCKSRFTNIMTMAMPWRNETYALCLWFVGGGGRLAAGAVLVGWGYQMCRGPSLRSLLFCTAIELDHQDQMEIKIKIPFVLCGDWTWPSRSNWIWKLKFAPSLKLSTP